MEEVRSNREHKSEEIKANLEAIYSMKPKPFQAKY